jgi:adenylate cyclase
VNTVTSYKFENCVVDTSCYQLVRGEQIIPVEPRVFDLLVYLIENRDRVVTRTELLETLWKGQIVSDSALSSRLKSARKAIGDSGKVQKFISTVHGRGYQFIDSVLERPHEVCPPAVERQQTSQALPNIPSIAVLPFINMSGDPAQEYFTDGLTEGIITQLSRFRDVFVIASHSSFAYKNKKVNIKEASTKLGVRYILEGSVQNSNKQVRISVQLIDGLSAQHLWSERYDHNHDDMFRLQDELTEVIVGTLASVYGGRLRKAWQNQSHTIRPENRQAFDYFMQGVDAVDLFTRDGNVRGREYLNKAIEIDPNYAKAYAKLSWTHILDAVEGWGDDYNASINMGKEMAAEAVKRDDNESWAHWALAACQMYARNYDVALANFDRVIELNPNDADALADYGYYLAYLGRADEGLIWMHKAMRLNPYYPNWYTAQLVQILHDAGRYADAIRQFQNLFEGEWIVARLYVAASQAAMGRQREAKETIARIYQLDPQSSISKWACHDRAPYKYMKNLKRFRTNLHKAGLVHHT